MVHSFSQNISNYLMPMYMKKCLLHHNLNEKCSHDTLIGIVMNQVKIGEIIATWTAEEILKI
jgi:hypothetical protein